jgi:eukaryotic-like serine/threonine-protein kinase
MAGGDTLETFGAYRVLRQIGSGGMATIFAAVDTTLGHRVAIKRLHPHIAARPGATERFLREGRAAARIRHPHVVQIFALGTAGETPYLAMELLEGSDLGTLLAREGKLGVEDALEIVLPVLAAVAAAHDAGVVHRDLKPSNVFVSTGARGRLWPKVLDFGVSKILDADGDGPTTATDGVIGTAAYMAPEQARGARNASFLSDQYSLGVLLYQCLTGELPFGTASIYDLLVAIMTAPLEPPSRRVPDLPEALDSIVLRAMNRNPADRYASVRAFGAALLPFARERDRSAWGAELHDGPVAERAAAASSFDPGSFPHPPTPPTMAPTARDTRAASRTSRVLRRAVGWLGVVAAAAGALAISQMGSPVSAGDPVPRASASAAQIEQLELAPPVAIHEAPALTPSPEPTAPASLAPPPRPRIEPKRPAPPARDMSSAVATATTTASAPAPAPPSSGKPAIGDNGAPILP